MHFGVFRCVSMRFGSSLVYFGTFLVCFAVFRCILVKVEVLPMGQSVSDTRKTRVLRTIKFRARALRRPRGLQPLGPAFYPGGLQRTRPRRRRAPLGPPTGRGRCLGLRPLVRGQRCRRVAPPGLGSQLGPGPRPPIPENGGATGSACHASPGTSFACGPNYISAKTTAAAGPVLAAFCSQVSGVGLKCTLRAPPWSRSSGVAPPGCSSSWA